MIGKTLVYYEITSQLGKGGMGEVYQAKDTKLGRDVAIKVLPEEFARDVDRVARFQREAKLLASLNHPNIAAIHGLEESDGTHFLVMELIEGDTLKDRIKSGPIPVEEALQLALQMAEALEAAHEKGVIHRDLKPANIKVTPEGKVKILDFGLAKAYAGDQENISPMDSPTISAAATRQGVILGTAAYMSPEQARGKPVDKRADIWAFGVVLYEMLTGKTAFSGDDVTDTLAAVIRSEPEWKSLPTNLHWRLREVLGRCLEKKVKDRCSGMSDARVEIQKVLADPSGLFVQPVSTAKPRKKLQVGISWIAATLALGLVIAGVTVWYLKPPEPRKVMRFHYELPNDQQFMTLELPTHAISPDGRQFVYSTTEGLFLRSVDQFDANLIPGADKVTLNPFFSPDSRWIGYFSINDSKLKKIAVSGGAPVVLCDSQILLGAVWNTDDTIIYGQLGIGLFRISANGGDPEPVIEGFYSAPQILPGGNAILFADVSAKPYTTMVQSFEAKEPKVLFAGLGAWYLPSGHLVYNLDNNLFAVPFDPDTLSVTGSAVSMIQGGTQHFISKSGTLAYIPVTGSGTSTDRLSLVWVDRKGNESPMAIDPGSYMYPRISPDGKKVALTIEDTGDTDIWIWDIDRESMTRLTFDGLNGVPLWTQDGERIVFMKNRGSAFSSIICWKAADGTGEEEELGSASALALLPWSWSSDGNNIALSEITNLNDLGIGTISLEGDHERKPFLNEDYNELQPKISPDGKWMAYTSNESGQLEIYVRPFPEVDKGKWLVSTGGGNTPLWSPDGRELFYLNGDVVMGVSVEPGTAFKAGKPETLFRGAYMGIDLNQIQPWDIHPDGKRFLMLKQTTTADGESAVEISRRVNIVLNWDEELKQRVPKK